MKRGELWTVRGSSYASKPRPVLIVQNDDLDLFDSIVLCLMTSQDSSDISTRVAIDPTEKNGLRKKSWVLTEKIYSARKGELGARIGTLSKEDMVKVSRQLSIVLDL